MLALCHKTARAYIYHTYVHVSTAEHYCFAPERVLPPISAAELRGITTPPSENPHGGHDLAVSTDGASDAFCRRNRRQNPRQPRLAVRVFTSNGNFLWTAACYPASPGGRTPRDNHAAFREPTRRSRLSRFRRRCLGRVLPPKSAAEHAAVSPRACYAVRITRPRPQGKLAENA